MGCIPSASSKKHLGCFWFMVTRCIAVNKTCACGGLWNKSLLCIFDLSVAYIFHFLDTAIWQYKDIQIFGLRIY